MIGHDVFLPAPLLALSFGIMIMLAATAWRRSAGRSLLGGMVTLLLALAVTGLHTGDIPGSKGDTLFIQDRWTTYTAALSMFSSMCILLMSWRDTAHEGAGTGDEYVLLFMLGTLGALAMVFSANYMPFFVGLEILGVSLMGLVAFRRRPATAGHEAAMKYLILSGVSSAILLFGIGLAYGVTGSLRFVPPVATADVPAALPVAATVMILVGMFFKLSAVPFHMWLPDVMEGAPVPVAAFLAVVSKIAIFSSLVRYFGMGEPPPFLNDILYAVIILTVLGGNLLALRQTTLPRLMACSSIAHVGYLLIAFVCPGLLQPGAITVYLAAYSASTLGVFAAMTAFAAPDGPEGTAVAQWAGLFSSRPFLASVMALMLLSLAGIPPSIGFLAKFQIAATGVAHQRDLLVCVLIIGSIIGLYYYLNIIRVMLATPSFPSASQSRDSRPELTALVIVLTIIVVIGGLFPVRTIHPLLPMRPAPPEMRDETAHWRADLR
ncbi:NADH-quinone oxidoreductase subunit N [Komagataeibacter oboediens]|uniref:NADH-quinone oxidoreductase subunit N n=1 Tax=Komagataeibacter oboediens TaxID=65958 RepID=A0ABS5SNC2_9PROT|nr:NADH-quinone oxidoreductase subunit N [Komagataeibacter oboediens]MBL7232177.1 NADH-quinone oxidoreductase subunit N [Komagataeibacter oboediens]MBT0675780.1 NADH-quinone oxidoreductase subunit N [Komagataeibacter oboediens]MBT0677830.1 NADH-quinone oxidoreductase subunit N [Komagataeibacter oboediens]